MDDETKRVTEHERNSQSLNLTYDFGSVHRSISITTHGKILNIESRL